MIIQCSQHAYDLLLTAKLPEKIAPFTGEIKQVLTHRNIFQGKAGDLVAHVEDVAALRAKKVPTFSAECYRDVTALTKLLEADWSPHDLARVKLPKHPYILAALVLGEDLQRFKEYGFSSERDLALAVTTYCVAEEGSFERDSKAHFWRNGERKTVISVSTHGDGSVMQYNLGGSEICLHDPDSHGFSLFQDTSPWLVVILQYMKHLRAFDLQEIIKWESLVGEFDRHSPWGAGLRSWREHRNEPSAMLLTLLDDYELLNAAKALSDDKSPTRIEGRNGVVWPIVEEDELILYSTNGDQVIYPWGEKGAAVKVTRIMKFTRQDLPDMLVGTYKTYARSRIEMCELMAHFCDREHIRHL